MTPWQREQEDYLLSKRDSEELAGFCFGAVMLMIFVGLALEVWDRFVAPLCRWVLA